jgi:glycosyltransferase involved in cell wall biosynthesis
MKKISIVTVIYNEEKRIKSFLESFKLADEIIIVNKSSTDNTLNIIKQYPNTKIINVENSNKHDLVKHAINLSKNDWVFVLTASDRIKPVFINILTSIINQTNFYYTGVLIPFANYVYGINNKRSPWYTKARLLLMNKNYIIFNNKIHHEVTIKPYKVYSIKYTNNSENYKVYHLTHPNIDHLLERHIRYAKIEAENLIENSKNRKIALRNLLSSFIYVFFKKKTILLGYDGIALSISYLTYFMLKFLFVWELKRSRNVYESIEKELIS